MSNYDTTKYEEKRSHGHDPMQGPEPAAGTAEFGARAKMRLARLQEAAINAARPAPSDLGTGMAARSAGAAKKHREELEAADE